MMVLVGIGLWDVFIYISVSVRVNDGHVCSPVTLRREVVSDRMKMGARALSRKRLGG